MSLTIGGHASRGSRVARRSGGALHESRTCGGGTVLRADAGVARARRVRPAHHAGVRRRVVGHEY